MSATRWVSAPLDPRLAAWRTLPMRRTVLVVVHTVASANRLADVTPIFESDPRIQLVYTVPGSSVVSEGIDQVLAEAGFLTIPWVQAITQRFDLALSANHSGDLHRLDAPVVLLSHGIGYTKYSPRTENREPARAIYGMSRRWLVRDGTVFAAAFVLSHPDQLRPLTAAVPEAADVAVVAGDPCLDRIRASRSRRDAYRRALGAGPHTTLVTLSSTWGPDSLLGAWPELPRALLAELDADRYRLVLVAHPHVWWTHGPAQLRMMLADAVRAGLTLVPPVAGWQQALLAADIVVGDHGAVTGYAAAAGIPTVLGAFGSDDVVPDTAIAALGATAARLDPARPLPGQLTDALVRHRPGTFAEVAARADAVPGEAAHRLRQLCYRLLDLAEPATPVPVHPFPASDLPAPAVPGAFLVTGSVSGTTVRVVRRAADVAFGPASRADPDGFLLVPEDHPVRVLRDSAAVRYRTTDPTDAVPAEWLAAVTAPPSACRVAAAIDRPGTCVVHSGGSYFRLRATDPGTPGEVLAAAVELLRRARPDAPVPHRLRLDLAGRTVPVTIAPVDLA